MKASTRVSSPCPATVESLATDSAGNLYVIYNGEIHKLSPAGAPLSPETFQIPKLAPFENPSATAVATDAAGHVYIFGPTNSSVCSGCQRDPIIEFDAAGNVIDEFGKEEFSGSTGLATNLCAGSEAPGNLYVSNFGAKSFLRAYGTNPVGCFKARTLPASNIEETAATLNGSVNPSGSLSSECRFAYGKTTEYGATVACVESPAEIGSGTEPVPVHAQLGSLTKGTVYHFRLLAKVKGVAEAGSDEAFKTLGPPVISADQTAGSTYTEATLRALVNPEGFTTTYRFQYTTQAEFEVHGFEGAQHTAELVVGSDRKGHAVIANLTGLAPGSAYRWRVLAVNSSGTTTSQDHAVNTYRTFAPQTDCPNQAFRTAASAPLPDCRAYEMVSPLDKNGADIVSGLSSFGDPGGYVQASPDGERLTYTAAYATYAGQPAGFKFNQYLAARGEEGWSNQGIHPPMPGHPIVEGGIYPLIRNFIVFSPDLCNAWVWDTQTPPLAADAQLGYPNLYRRQNCGEGSGQLETLTSSPLPLSSATSKNYVYASSVQGLSTDSRHALFIAKAKLTPDASPALNSGKPIAQVYDRFDGANHLVSVLPGGEANPTDATVGNGPNGLQQPPRNLAGAVSTDGSRVYWTAGINNLSNGKIYLRRHPEQGIVAGECSEAAKACTLPVSAGAGAFFWGAAADGSKALYGQGSEGSEDLFEFDLKKAEAEEPPRRLIAHHVTGVAGISEDLSRVYFVSTDALPGSGKNSEGDEAVGGQPNLYLEEEGAKSFVATLVVDDVQAAASTVDSAAPYDRATRVTPDGTRIAFDSRAPLTGYDNAGAEDGRPAVEVFTYAAGGALSCVSCNPSGARPSVRELRLPYKSPFEVSTVTNVTAAAWIPTWEHMLHASNVLSADGTRLFFNANDALIPSDTNGSPDVYEWEAAGTGGCIEESPSYFRQNGGCLYLISSGESAGESEFWEASPDGKNVFFTTPSSLLPQDPGLIDLYDARVGGGFPAPVKASACEGETCQPPSQAPNDPTPASAAFRGAGNLKGGGSKPRELPQGQAPGAPGRRGPLCAKHSTAEPTTTGGPPDEATHVHPRRGLPANAGPRGACPG